MDEHLVEDALGDVFDRDQPPPRVEAHDLEVFDLIESVGFPEGFGNSFRGVEQGCFPSAFLTQTLSQKEGRADSRRLGFPDPFQLLKFLEGGPGERRETSEALQKCGRRRENGGKAAV